MRGSKLKEVYKEDDIWKIIENARDNIGPIRDNCRELGAEWRDMEYKV